MGALRLHGSTDVMRQCGALHRTVPSAFTHALCLLRAKPDETIGWIIKKAASKEAASKEAASKEEVSKEAAAKEKQPRRRQPLMEVSPQGRV